MSNDHIKLIGAAAAIIVLVGRVYWRVRGMQGDARDMELRKTLSGSMLPIAVMTGLLLYFLFARA